MTRSVRIKLNGVEAKPGWAGHDLLLYGRTPGGKSLIVKVEIDEVLMAGELGAKVRKLIRASQDAAAEALSKHGGAE